MTFFSVRSQSGKVEKIKHFKNLRKKILKKNVHCNQCCAREKKKYELATLNMSMRRYEAHTHISYFDF